MKYRIRRRILAAAVLLLCACLFFGCHKDGGKPGTQNGGQKNAAAGTDASPDLVFRGVQINPEGPIVDPLIRPYVDPDGNFIIAALEGRQADGTYGTVRLERNKDGVWEILPDTYRPFLLPAGMSPSKGVLTDSGAVLLTYQAGAYSVALLDENYACTASVAVNKVLPGTAYPSGFSVSADGSIWIVSTSAYAVLEPDLSVRSADRSDMPLEAVAADDEGGAWLLSGSQVLCMNRNGQLISTLRIDEQIDPSMGAIYCFDGVLYAAVSRGLIAYRDGAWSLAVDYAAADITRNHTFPCALLADGEMLFHLYNGSRMVLWDYRYVPRPTGTAEPIRLEIVTSYGDHNTGFSTIVADFNRSQDRIRVEVKRLSDRYGYDLEQANQAFGMDLVTGVYRPDMVYYMNIETLNAIAQHGLYVDLSWYLWNDEDINFDNLFGAARRTVTYRDTIWGMPLTITFHTLVSRNDILGDYAGRSGWTVGEEISFIRSLPDDIEPMSGLRQDLAPYFLTCSRDLRSFVDMETMTCSFTSPDAVAFLEYVAGRPTTNGELSKVSRIDSAKLYEPDEALRLQHEGKVALEMFTFRTPFDYFGKYSCFFTDDVTMIGYPTNTPDNAYAGFVTDIESWTGDELGSELVILKDAAHPEACWEFIKFALRANGSTSVLKDAFEKSVEDLDGSLFVYYEAGGSALNDEYNRAGKPAKRMTFHKEDAAELRNILENAGRPWLVGYNESLTEIVEEELSALTAKHTTPQECAERLQSRVSLWLEERK